ncbi:peptide chain release factor N(5)-glutamine methyltransferase [Tumebacillus sp. ITR2]|uniref:Release factor glutamine methyltransferase n=2 Tax=Tumebacillus amylolyticus TaxID=2801339 RepID=A0ABS1J552_9BACL|nr:peptide chain release factor N(5)-glutamine methyltransferase [Tumebacillus amylolyticus]
MGASRFFDSVGVRSPQYNAEVLVQHVMGVDKTRMLMLWNDPFPEEKRAFFDELVKRRAEQEPLQYLTGATDFYGRDFVVSPAVLIPRPETELLIEQVLGQRGVFEERLGGRAPVIVDIGTGSGAIAITLALEWVGAKVYSVDISEEALAVARENAERLGASVEFLHGDLVEPLLEKGIRADLVVSNPPYIPTADCEELDVEVRDHEPRLALDGGPDGMYPYRVISSALPRLWPESGPGYVAYEVGIHQDVFVESMIAEAVEGVDTGILPDWQGIGRVIWGLRR